MPKKFEFKLQSLLNFRRHKELIAQQEVSQAVMDLLNCQEQIKSLEEQRAGAEVVLEERVKEGVSATVFNQYSDYITGLGYSIQRERQQEVHYETVLTEKRKILKQRSIDKKAMERLREKRKLEHTQMLLYEEQKELDEISSLKTARDIANALE